MQIRREKPDDIDGIRRLNNLAFGQTMEGCLVDRLRENCRELLSLVAVNDEGIIGHILFSPVAIEARERRLPGMGLGPMAVLPRRQRSGVGKQLVERGIEKLKELGYPFLVVLGHPEYYPRFGFEPAYRFGISSQWKVPKEAFMVLFLDPQIMRSMTGIVRYRPEFSHFR